LATQIGTAVRERIDREAAGEEAFLSHFAGHAAGAILRAESAAPLPGTPSRLRFLRKASDQRVLRREHHERRAEDRVDARREHFDRIVRPGSGTDARAFRSPDPVALHRQHFLGPLRQAFGRLQQIIGVGGDLEEPLLQVLLDHRVPQRQQAPSTTCSFASTVLSTGHQFTVERRRYASPSRTSA
jgi:hypothetical protein